MTGEDEGETCVCCPIEGEECIGEEETGREEEEDGEGVARSDDSIDNDGFKDGEEEGEEVEVEVEEEEEDELTSSTREGVSGRGGLDIHT